MKKNFWQMLLVALLILGMSACENEREEYDYSGYINLGTVEIQYTEEEYVQNFVISPENEIHMVKGTELVKYDLKENSIDTIPLNAPHNFLCFSGTKEYAYDFEKGAIIEINGENSSIICTKNFNTIRNIVIFDSYIYVLGIELTEENSDVIYPFGTQNYEDYGQKVWRFDRNSGIFDVLPAEKITAIYRSENNELWMYGWENNQYYLYRYDSSAEKEISKKHIKNGQNLLSIVVEAGRLFGISVDNQLIGVDLKSGEIQLLRDNIISIAGYDLQFLRGNLFCREYLSHRIVNTLTIDTNGNITLIELSKIAESEPEEVDPNSEIEETAYTIKIGVLNKSDTGLSLYDVNNQTGMKSEYYEYPMEYEALSVELMAGNPDVDIYVLGTYSPLALQCRNMGYYCALNESSELTDYINGCFSGIRDAAMTENGDIWMLPLSGQIKLTWYVPENMEKYGVQPEELETISGFLAVAERLQGQLKLDDCHFYVDYPLYFLESFDQVYDLNYNDYNTGKVDFDTPAYRELAYELWTGWYLYGMPPVENKHPLLWTSTYEASLTGETLSYAYRMEDDITRTIFKFGPSFMYLRNNDFSTLEKSTKTLTNWRALSCPKINVDDKTPMLLNFMIINPFSTHKAEAMSYLAAIAQNHQKTVSAPDIFQKDMSYYDGRFDTTLPGFQDLYNIFSDTAVLFSHSWDQGDEAYLLDYQRGLTTFDRAIKRRQERAVFEIME